MTSVNCLVKSPPDANWGFLRLATVTCTLDQVLNQVSDGCQLGRSKSSIRLAAVTCSLHQVSDGCELGRSKSSLRLATVTCWLNPASNGCQRGRSTVGNGRQPGRSTVDRHLFSRQGSDGNPEDNRFGDAAVLRLPSWLPSSNLERVTLRASAARTLLQRETPLKSQSDDHTRKNTMVSIKS